MQFTAFAPGKIILCGEYAVVFGGSGIGIPSRTGMRVTFFEQLGRPDLTIEWRQEEAVAAWLEYAQTIAELAQGEDDLRFGTLRIESDLPLGRGMGSSTALVIAITKTLHADPVTGLSDTQLRALALSIEDDVNPGHSGIDFALIWNNEPLRFRRGEDPQPISLPPDLLSHAVLIDTGAPLERTPELVAWVQDRAEELADPLLVIGNCADRLLSGENPLTVIRDHHRAQVALGVVPEAVQEFIKTIELAGGAAKVIGAGGQTGSGGMVLAIGIDPDDAIDIAVKRNYNGRRL